MPGLRERALTELAGHPVTVDLGGGEAFQKHLKPWKARFAGRRFWSVDVRPQARPDVAGDLLRLPFPSGSLPGIVCCSVLEHIAEPARAVEEMRRVLRPGGLAYAYVPFLFPDHGNAEYGDYWRFTALGLRHLFRAFSSVEIEARDDYAAATLRFMLGFRVSEFAVERALGPFRGALNLFARAVKGSPIGRGRQTTGFDVAARR